MSATGRGAVRSDSDYYPTPPWCVRRLLEACQLPGGVWLEPGAGEGSIIRAVNAVRNDVKWVPVEVRPECQAKLDELVGAAFVSIGDFLALRAGMESTGLPLYPVALGNPPFSLAQAFVEEALRWSQQVVFLLRLAFLESAERAGWWRTHPADVYVIPDRPSFSGKGTDSCAYAWFRWFRSRSSGHGSLQVLPVTPDSEKEEDRGQLALFSGPPEPAQAVLL